MNGKEGSRRRFLKESVALAGLAAGAMRPSAGRGQTPNSEEPPQKWHVYGERSHFENWGRKKLPFSTFEALTPLQDTVGIITPAPLHYVVMRWRNEPPDIDPRQHRLLIHGMVDRPLILSMEELKRLPAVSRIHLIECAGNSSPLFGSQSPETAGEAHGLTSCSEWTGVELSLLLKEAGVQNGARWLVAESADAGKHQMSIPLEKGMLDVIVAYGQNGEAVRPEQGYPIRLLVPGFEGVRNVKWLRRIKVVDQPYLTKSEATEYPVLRPNLEGKAFWYNLEMGPKSVITFPSGGQRLGSPGFYEISGLAWSGGGAVRKVEVSTDGGQTWKEAQLQEPVHRIAHTRFRLPWTWDGGEVVLQSRCTDDRGSVQPSLAEFAKTWGVQPDFFKKPGTNVNHMNLIWPWKVTRDGSVHNALFS